MRTPIATIRLSPTSMTLESSSAKAVKALDPATWGDIWSRGLTDLVPALKSLVAETGLEGASVSLLFDSPNAHAGVVSIPGSGRTATDAALLSLEEQLGPLDDLCVAAEVIAKDASRSHVLVCAEQEHAAEQAARLAECAGLKPAEQRSLLAASLRCAVSAAMQTCSANDSIAQLTFEDDRLVVCVATRGKLVFVRSATVGLSHLATSLARQLGNQSDAPSAADIARAMDVLRDSGIPDRNSSIPGTDLRGRDVLPAMQSVLQRVALELRQSVRFGLPSEAPRPVRLALHGQATRIANFGELLALELEHDDFSASIERVESGGGRAASSPLLLPRSARERRSRRRSQGFAVAGLALACAVTGVEAGWNLLNAGSRESERFSIAASSPTGEQLQADLAEARFKVSRAHAQLAVLDEQLGASAEIAPVLRQIATSKPERVRITDLSFSTQSRRPTCQVWGLVTSEQGGVADKSGARALLVEFAQELERSPIVEVVQLGSTSRAEQRGVESVRFGLTISLVPTSKLALLETGEAGVSP